MIIGSSWHCLARYLLAGGFVFAAGHGQYRLIYLLLAGAPSRASLAWALHFVLGTLWTHALHRRFTFRHVPRRPYWNSLARTSSAYLVLGVMSTTMMLVLCDLSEQNAIAGWLLTTLITALFNFTVMSRWSICAPIEGSTHGPEEFDPDRTH